MLQVVIVILSKDVRKSIKYLVTASVEWLEHLPCMDTFWYLELLVRDSLL